MSERRVPYTYLRGLELEGRHPADAGGWPVTIRRLETGEGTPVESMPEATVLIPADGPLPPAPSLPRPVLRPNRIGYYRRLRSALDCDRHLHERPGWVVPGVALKLTPGWVEPPAGVIPEPAPGDPVLDMTHAVRIVTRQPDRRLFRFENWWGAGWGDGGNGYLPYSYFDRYVFECWGTYQGMSGLRLFKRRQLDRPGLSSWTAFDEADARVYGFGVADDRDDERHGWAFVVERDGALEVEELYVRPEYRGRGHGRWLADRVRQLARETGRPLRVWVPFADCRRESERTYPALVATAARLGARFGPCPVPWAAYFATDERPGAGEPVEPADIPERPRSPLAAVVAAALALSAPAPSADARPAAPAVEPPGPSPDVLADLDRVAHAVAAGGPIDPELLRRVRERSERVQERLRREYGVRNIAVDLIREVRDEE